MYTNPFNYSANLFARAPDLTADLLFSEYQVLALGQAHSLLIFGNDASLVGCPGGLKGQMAPGDAHPYLALFGVLK